MCRHAAEKPSRQVCGLCAHVSEAVSGEQPLVWLDACRACVRFHTVINMENDAGEFSVLVVNALGWIPLSANMYSLSKKHRTAAITRRI